MFTQQYENQYNAVASTAEYPTQMQSGAFRDTKNGLSFTGCSAAGC